MEEIAKNIKVVLIGDTQVGKTSLANRFVNDSFEKNLPTISNICLKKIYNCNDQLFSIDIWDTAGQEKYRSLAPLVYRNSNAILMVFSCDDDKTLEALENWEENLLQSIDPSSASIYIVASKSDLVDQIDQQKIINKAKNKFSDIDKNNFFIVSSKDGSGINEMFDHLVNCYIDNNSVNISKKGIELDSISDTKSCC